ncbi:MAG: asparagine--tRNA ligase, partial [Gemmatimonadetes bacterium]|nr:asparagine--tRNA ligase [Gemmatimonadota bacterium]
MQTTHPLASVKKLGEFVDQDVRLQGWLYGGRSSGKIAFLMIRDGTGVVQGVLAKSDVEDEEMFQAARKIPQESSIIVTGKVRQDDRAPGGYELLLSHVETHSEAGEYPITPKEHG